MWTTPRRCLWRLSRSRLIRIILFVFILWDALEVRYIWQRHRQLELVPPPPRREAEEAPMRIYIASLHWNSEAILRNHWNEAVLDLARALGSRNLFVSVHESGSWDDTPGALRELDGALKSLGVATSIVLDKTTHEDEISSSPAANATGWVDTLRGRLMLRRIPYLARLRNKSLESLRELAERGVTFDRVLFLNDVVFTADDVLQLLHTNNGNYAAACALDFAQFPAFYDTFALRDSDGHECATSTWPYFCSRRSRQAVKRGMPVPVRSCWNGMVSMSASVFISSRQDGGENSSSKSVYQYAPPLSFRGIDDSLASHHLEGSECCLIHADNEALQKANSSGGNATGVYLNPAVRVGYDRASYDAAHRPAGNWGLPWFCSNPGRILMALWKNRLARWLTTPIVKEWRVRKLVQHWEAADPDGHRTEKGAFCLVNEMQVLVENGWAHV